MLKNNYHPGIFLQELLDEYNITAYKLSKDTFLQQTRISQILKGTRAISEDTAQRLARYFTTSPQYWLNLQHSYNLSNQHNDDYKNIVPITLQIHKSHQV